MHVGVQVKISSIKTSANWVDPSRQLSPFSGSFLTPPHWDAEEKQKGQSMKTFELK